MKLSLIVARSLDDVIGIGNRLPWHYPAELQQFKAITTDKVIAMGRKTWDSLPTRPLPDRVNIIVTDNPQNIARPTAVKGHPVVCSSIDEAIKYAESIGAPELVFIGGASIYNAVVDRVDEVHLTEINMCVSELVEHPETVLFQHHFSTCDPDNGWTIKYQSKQVDSMDRELYKYSHLVRK